MKNGLVLALLMLFNVSGSALAQFEGELELEPDGCEVDGKCFTKQALRYTDPNNLVWEAKKGLETDGASIPLWAQPFVGKPYDQSYLKAAVVHDHYCDRHVRSWRSTHRVFYHMLKDLGVPTAKAKVMYYAVFIGGPKWVEIVQPVDCGFNCINEFKKLKSTEKIRIQPATFDSIKNLEARLDAMSKKVENSDLSLEEIDEFAVSENPDHLFYKFGDTIEFDQSNEF